MIVRARVFGDDVNTDYIITSLRKRESLDPAVLRAWIFETLDPTFAASVREGDVIVAGRNFGCGSAMEVAVTALAGAGIRAVLARSFSRTYYRNAVNNGLLPVVCDTRAIVEGETLEVTADGVRRASTGDRLESEPLPDIMREIVDAGGLVGYIRKHAR